MSKGAWSLLVITCCVLPPASAAGQEPRPVLVFPIQPVGNGVDAARADRAHDLLVAAMHQVDRITVAPWMAAATGAGETADALDPEVGKALAAGDPARAREAALKSARAAEAADAFVEASLKEAWTRLATPADEASARALLRDALTVRPKLTAPAGAPAGLAPLIDAVRAEVADAGTGTLTVASSPIGADVFIDGETKGRTPVTLRSVLAGHHFIRITHAGHVAHGEVAHVSAGKAVSVEATLKAARTQDTDADAVAAALRRGTLTREARTALARVADRQGHVPHVAFGAFHRSAGGTPALSLYVLGTERSEVMRTGEFELDPDDFGADTQAARAAGALATTITELPDPLFTDEVTLVEPATPADTAMPVPSPRRERTPASR
jgi:hypothetical protein